MCGWGVGVWFDVCVILFAQGWVIRLIGLAREVIMRAASWPLDQLLDAAQQRLVVVLLEELW